MDRRSHWLLAIALAVGCGGGGGGMLEGPPPDFSGEWTYEGQFTVDSCDAMPGNPILRGTMRIETMEFGALLDISPETGAPCTEGLPLMAEGGTLVWRSDQIVYQQGCPIRMRQDFTMVMRGADIECTYRVIGSYSGGACGPPSECELTQTIHAGRCEGCYQECAASTGDSFRIM